MSAGDHPVSLGNRLREVRLAQGRTLPEVAEATGLTKGFLSQVERDLAAPSVATLVKICSALDLAMSALFEGPNTAFVTSTQRPRIEMGGHGLIEHLLTPSAGARIAVIESVIEPGGGSGEEPYALRSEGEFVYVIAGQLEITVGSETFLMNAGDALSFSARDPHSWHNPSRTDSTHVLWVAGQRF